ncbi:MAG: peptidylprolyl isomerase [Bacteriovoracia bacterium]
MKYLMALGVCVAFSNVATAAVVAEINNKQITLDYFNEKYQESVKFYQYNPPTKANVLDEIIKRELGIQEAVKMGLDKDPEVIDRMQTVLYRALLDRRLGKEMEKIEVTDGEAKSFYDKNPEIRTSHIFIALAPNATPAQEKEARARLQDIKTKFLDPGKMSFAEVAQRYSQGSAAPMGGDLDYQTKDKLDPKYYETAVALRNPGAVSGIVRTRFGLHIIKLTAVRKWNDADKAKFKRLVFEEQRTEIFEKFMKSLRGKSKVSVNAALIKE